MSDVETETDDWWLELRRESNGEWVAWLHGTFEEVMGEMFEWRYTRVHQGYDRSRITAPEVTL